MRPIIALTALLAVAPVASAQDIVGRSQEVFTWNERVVRGAWFRFFAPTGEITVTEGSGDRVEVRAEKVLRRGNVEDIGFTVVRDGDNYTVCAVYDDDDECNEDGMRRRWNDWGRRRGYASLDVTVRLPAGVKLRVQSGNGAVSVTGAGDEVIAGSGNGRVRVNGSGGEVRASSGNGAVTVENARGAVTASSGNGDVTVRTTRGPVSASSGNGDVQVTMDALQDSENMEFSTGNGRVSLYLPADFAAELDASTGNGTVTSDFPITVSGRISKSRLRGTIGQGGRRVRISSGNGRIELLRRG